MRSDPKQGLRKRSRGMAQYKLRRTCNFVENGEVLEVYYPDTKETIEIPRPRRQSCDVAVIEEPSAYVTPVASVNERCAPSKISPCSKRFWCCFE